MKPFRGNRLAMLSWWIAILLVATQIDIAFTQDNQYGGKFSQQTVHFMQLNKSKQPVSIWPRIKQHSIHKLHTTRACVRTRNIIH